MTAALAAGRRQMDWVGVIIIACVTALGGGTLRNIILGHYPMTWIEHPEYILITAGASIGAALLASMMKKLKLMFLWLDALGLVVFTIIGCRLAMDLQMPMLIIVLSGIITGCGGGVLRDILCNDIPLLFRKEVYATASLFTGLVYIGIMQLGYGTHAAAIIAAVLGFILRLLAIRYKWQMPKFVYNEKEEF